MHLRPLNVQLERLYCLVKWILKWELKLWMHVFSNGLAKFRLQGTGDTGKYKEDRIASDTVMAWGHITPDS